MANEKHRNLSRSTYNFCESSTLLGFRWIGLVAGLVFATTLEGALLLREFQKLRRPRSYGAPDRAQAVRCFNLRTPGLPRSQKPSSHAASPSFRSRNRPLRVLGSDVGPELGVPSAGVVAGIAIVDLCEGAANSRGFGSG